MYNPGLTGGVGKLRPVAGKAGPVPQPFPLRLWRAERLT